MQGRWIQGIGAKSHLEHIDQAVPIVGDLHDLGLGDLGEGGATQRQQKESDEQPAERQWDTRPRDPRVGKGD